uniref:Uncharacterized protein n=1 Tax=Acrobeloides nanus TaxID=290746 RepID=A0A914D5D8_9BILA
MYAQLRAMAILYIILFIVGVINGKDIVNRQAPNAQNLDLMQLLMNDLDLISSDVAELVIRSTSDDKKNPKMMLDVSFSVKVKSRRSFILEEDDEPISSVLRLDDIHEDINKMIKRKLAQAEESIAIPSNHI